MSIAAALPPSFEPLAHGLHRPECVLGTPAGDVFVPDWRGGVMVVRADGRQEAWLAHNAGFELRPNGIAVNATARSCWRISGTQVEYGGSTGRARSRRGWSRSTVSPCRRPTL
jgi:hypothetical protein